MRVSAIPQGHEKENRKNEKRGGLGHQQTIIDPDIGVDRRDTSRYQAHALVPDHSANEPHHHHPKRSQ